MKALIPLLALAIAFPDLTAKVLAAVDPISFGSRAGDTYTATWSGSTAIPDNNLSGVAFSLNFNDPSENRISGLTVSFAIQGGWNGDMYAYLSHGDGQVVLLNRIGRSSATPDGSGTSGFDLNTFTLSSAPLLTDVHTAAGTTGAPLAGTYAPDGRKILPTADAPTFDGATRDATFTALLGSNPNGDWTLFFADVGPGSPFTLTDFRIVAEVPEPVTWALLAFATVFGFVHVVRLCRRRFPSAAVD